MRRNARRLKESGHTITALLISLVKTWFMLFEKRDDAAANAFFARTFSNNGFPNRVVIDKRGANLARLENIKSILILIVWYWLIELFQVKYLKNTIEEDHRFIKKLIKQMKGFKSIGLVTTTLDGIEVAYMICKQQFGTLGQLTLQQFSALAR